jgi:glycoside/pentoside/hexuronide:cation symporter, GPH family
MASTQKSDRLPVKTKLLYGVGDIGNAIVNSAIQFFLMIFYTDAALITPSVAGSALFIGKLWDAVNDPLFGWISDRTSSARFGKRRVFMIFGAIPLGLSIILLWFVPKNLSLVLTFVWVALTFIIFDTLWTLTNVPYYALTSELTDDYDERASLTTYRMVLAVPGYLIGAALTPAIVGFFVMKSTGYNFIGILYGIIASACLLIAAAGIHEKKKIVENSSETPFFQSIILTFRNQPFVRLLIAYFILNLSFALIKTLMVYFLTYQLFMEKQVSMVMGLMLVCVVIGLFPWKKLSERWNKGPAYALGMALGGFAVALTFLLPHQPTPWVYLVAVLAGLGFSAQWVFPWSMIPDVADYDRLETGDYRSGMYYGVWGLITKFSEAAAIAGAGWVLSLFHYVPNVAQSPETLFGIRIFFGVIPVIFILAALPLLIWYPITRKSHRALRDALEAAGK